MTCLKFCPMVPLSRETVAGHKNAIQRLEELSKQTSNEVRVMHVLSDTLIASLNGPKP